MLLNNKIIISTYYMIISNNSNTILSVLLASLRGSRTFKVMIINFFNIFFNYIIILILVFFSICKKIRHEFNLKMA